MVGTLLPAPPNSRAGMRVGQQAGLPRMQGSGSRMQPGLGPEGPAACGARGPCLGAGPNSIPQQPHACGRPVSNSSPGVTGSRGGAPAPPPRPTFQGSPGCSTRWDSGSPQAQLSPPR